VNDTRFVASSFLTIFFVLGFIAPRSSAFVSWFGDRVRSTIVSIRSTGEGARGASDAVYPPPLGRKARKGGEASPRGPASFRGSLLSNPFFYPLRRRERRARIITAQNLPTCPKPRDFYAVEARSQLHLGPWKRRRSWNSARGGGSTKMVVDGERW
jgi:hypothetical protein